jgi:hypothetical protein
VVKRWDEWGKQVEKIRENRVIGGREDSGIYDKCKKGGIHKYGYRGYEL